MEGRFFKYCFVVIIMLCINAIDGYAQAPCGGGDERGAFGCPPILEFLGLKPPAPGTAINIPVVRSADPNEISGPTGLNLGRWVAKKDRLGYTIYFENDPKFATAPAQIVKVNLPVDPKLNINSVRLGNYGFGQFNFDVPPNSTFYSQRLDLRDSLGIYVDVTAGIDVVKREVFWVFETIDPLTGFAPDDPTKGFLPVNDSTSVNDTITGKGEGFVTFSIVPASSTITGDTVKAKASIVFDINAAIETNTWTNVVDAFAPTSVLDSLPPIVSLGDSLHLTWTAQDDSGGVGVRSYDVYASKDGGPFLLIAQNLDTAYFRFAGAPGSTYDFYTRATDSVGNIENAKFIGEQTVLFSSYVQLLASIVAKTDSLCAGADAVFTVRGTNGATLRYTLSNSTDTLSLALTGNNQQILVADALGSITLRLHRIVIGSDSLAQDTVTTIQVFAIPTASIVGNNGPICTGTSAEFTVSGTAGAILTYQLSTLSGEQTLLLTGTNQSITVANATAEIILSLLKVQTATKPNCSRLLNLTDSIQILARPTAQIVANNGPIVAGTNAVFTVKGTANATLTYTLTGQAGNQSLLLTGNVQNITVSNASSALTLALVEVATTTAPTCTTALDTSAIIEVIAPPTAQILSNNGPICAGDTAVFVVNGTVGAVLTYQLNGQAGNQTLALTGSNQQILVYGVTASSILTLLNVEIPNLANSTVTLNQQNTVEVIALPTANLVSADSPVCVGSNARFTVLGTTGATLTYRLNGQAQTLVLTGSNQLIEVNSPPADVILALEKVSISGCETLLNARDTVLILPAPSATLVADNGPVCVGTDAVFTIQGTAGATLSYSLSGQSGTQTLLLTGNNQTITTLAATADVYLALLQVASGGSPVCTTILTAKDTIRTRPNPTAQLVTNNGPIAAGSTGIFTVQGSAGAVLTYTLTGQSGNQTLALTGSNQTIEIPAASIDLTLQLISVAYANAPICTEALNASATIEVIPLPTAQILSSNDPICAGDTAVFTIKGSAGATLTYSLSDQPGSQTLALTGINQTILVYGVNTPSILTLQSVEILGLANSKVSLGTKDTVGVIALPVASIVTADESVCTGTTAHFTVQGTAGATLTYQLSNQAQAQTLLLTGSNQVIEVNNVTAELVLTLQKVSITGCETSLTAKDTVKVLTAPTASIVTANGPICAGEDAVFTIQGTAGATLSYTLTGQNGTQTLLLTGTNQTITVPTASSDVYLELLEVSSAGSPSCTSILNGLDTVKVLAKPAAQTIADNGPVCVGTDAVFTVQGTAGATLSYTLSGQSGTQTLLLTGNNQTITAPAATADVYLALLQVASGGSPVCTTILTALDTIKTRPNPTAQLVGNNGPIAAGSTAIFTVQGSAGAVLTYTLTGQSGNQTLALTGSNQTIEIPAASIDLTLQLISVAYANAPTCTVSLNAIATLEVIPLPTAQIVASNDPICTGDTAVFTVKGSAGATLTYSLSGQAGSQTLALTGADQTILVYGVSTPSILTLQSVEIPGLANSTVSLGAKDTVGVIALPVASIVTADESICTGTTAHFTVQGTAGATLTYQLSNQAQAQTLLLTGSNQVLEVNNVTADLVLTLQKVSITGCETLLTAKDTVKVLSAPTASIVTENGPICAGDAVVFTIQGTAGATLSYTLTGQNGTQSLLLTGTSQTITMSGANLDVYLALLQVSSAGSPTCTTTLTALDTVKVLAKPTAKIVADNGPIASGSNAIFSIKGTAGAVLTYALTGQVGNQTLALNGNNQTISFPAATLDVTLQLLGVAYPNNPACSVILDTMATISITALPSASIVGNNAPICTGDTAVFVVKGTAGAVLTYQLSGQLAQTLALTGSNQQILVYDVTAPSILTLLSVEIPNLANSTVALNLQDTVEVIALPTASLLTADSPVCVGSNARFTVVGTSGATLTYRLNGQAQTLVLTGSNQVIEVSAPPADVILALEKVSISGCETLLNARDTVLILPAPSANLVADNGPICVGTDAVFTIQGTAGATLSYTLSGQSATQTLLLTGNSQSITASAATADVYLTLLQVASGGSPVCTTILTAKDTIRTRPNPTAQLVTNNGPITAGSTAIFTVQGSTGAVLTYTLTGQNGSQTLALTGSNQTIEIPAANTDLTLQLISVAYVNAPTCTVALDTSANISVIPLPTAQIVASNDPICTSDTAIFTVKGSAGATLTYSLSGQLGSQTLALTGVDQTILVYVVTTPSILTLQSVEIPGLANSTVTLSAKDTVGVIALPLASIVSADSPICTGTTAHFTVVGTAGATLTYTLSNQAQAQTLLLTGGNQVIEVNNVTAELVLSLQKVNIAGCETLLTAKDTVQILPTATAQLVANNGPICAGGDAVFSVKGTAGATLSYALTGLIGTQTLLLNGSDQTITAASATAPVELTLLSINSNTVPVCTTALNLKDTVQLIEAPTALILSNNGPILDGATAVFTIQGTAGAILEYGLTGQAGTLNVQLNGPPQNISVPNVTSNVTLSLFSVNLPDRPNCNVALSASSTVALTASPTAAILANNGPICADSTATFTIKGTAGATLTYNLNGTGTQTLTLTGLNQILQVTGATSNVVLELLSVEIPSVANSAVALGDKDTVQVIPAPVASIVGNNGPIAEGADASFSVIGTSGAVLTYTLTGVAGAQTLVLTGVNQTLIASNAQQSITLSLLSVENPVSPNCVQPLTAASTVTVIPVFNLVAAIVAADTVCSGEQGIFKVKGTNGATLTYQLSGGAAQTLLLDGSIQSITLPNLSANVTLTLIKVEVLNTPNSSQNLDTNAVILVNARPTVSLAGVDFLCQDSTILFSGTATGSAISAGVLHQWTQTGVGAVLITNLGNGTATFKGLSLGKVFITYNVVDTNGCSALTPALDSLIVLDCGAGTFPLVNDSPGENSNQEEYMIGDPCTCAGNGLFDETVWIEPSLPNEVWTVKSITSSRIGGTAPLLISAGTALTYRQINTGLGIHEIAFQHVDSSGFSIVVEGPNAPGTMGNVLRSISNICYYPDIAISNIPAVISADANAFVVTGTAANQAAGTGTFTLNGVVQTGAGPSPTQLSINPSSLPAGLNTLTYTFDAGAAGSNQLNDPGCAVSLTTTFRVASGPCACQDIRVTLDQNCQFRLSAALIANGNCINATVRVMDDNPNNGDLIDCPGVWTYGLFDANNNIICWGKVTAEDKTPPAIICTNWVKDTLDCYDVSYVLNNHRTIGNVGETASPRPAANNLQAILNAEGVPGSGSCGLLPPTLVADNVNNLGYAYFEDNCRDCGCRTAVRWSDRVVFYGCDEMKTNGGIYARIFRTWTATDCKGMLKDTVQEILFSRPSLKLATGNDALGLRFRGAGSPGALAKVPAPGYDWVVEYPSCTPDKNLIKKEDVTPSFCSYFNRLVDPKNNRCLFIDQVECNYAVQIKDTEFPICNGKGLKIDRELYIFDWCSGGIVDTLHILIKIGDFAGPELIKPDHFPEISTGPMDCTAAFPINANGLKNTFGVEIRDCNLSNISVSVKTKDRYVKGILVPENTWEEVKYPVMNGQMFGVPPGRHRMIFFAVDACYGASVDSFEFEVKDKIAPVLKCDDDLTITLSNANGYSKGYASLSAEDIDEGSWDNCKLAWLAVRRKVTLACESDFLAKGFDSNGNGQIDALPFDNTLPEEQWPSVIWKDATGTYRYDGIDRNGDGDIEDRGEAFSTKGDKKMTPLQTTVDFFCCDITDQVSIELWGADSSGNWNYCWNDVAVEDKVAPTCQAPWNTEIYCDNKNLGLIDDRAQSALTWGDVAITSGGDCGILQIDYRTEKHLKCGYGTIERIWVVTKQTAKGPLSVTCTQIIQVLPVREYDICFPKDANSDCKTPIVDTLKKDELGCSLLTINVSDKRYDATDGECYKLFRTFTVVDWCAYDDRCGDPVQVGNVYVVDRAKFENYGKRPIYVLVRDREYSVKMTGRFSVANGNERKFTQDGDEEFWLSMDQSVGNTIRLDGVDRADELFNADLNKCITSNEYPHSFMYTQVIRVYDNDRPVVSGVRDTFCADPADCRGKVTKVVRIEDNCTDQVELELQQLMVAPHQTLNAGSMMVYNPNTWLVKKLDSGQFEISISNLPEGTHDLIVVSRDECGNLSLATRIPFVVKDCKAPAPICINGLAVDLMPNGQGDGMMTIWATDFIASKIFDCNGQGPETKDGLKLISKYSVNRVGEAPNPSSTNIAVNCADKNKTVLVELHAWDERGNHDFCVTFIEVQDNRKVCNDVINPNLGEIAGAITTDDLEPIPGAKVDISGGAQMSQNTGVNGGFNFSRLLKANDYTLTAQLDKNYLNGVSTFDLILLQKHILGILPITNPYRLIAGDANNSKSISTLDIIQIRKLILGIDERFKSVPSWRFVDAAYQFANPSNPWLEAFPEVINVNDLDGAAIANFIGIKIGDVNGNASPNGFMTAEVRSDKKMLLNLEELDLRKGESYTVAITSKDLAKFQGYQFTLGVDPAQVQIEGIEYTGIMKPENFGLFLRNSLISGSYHASNGLSTKGNTSDKDMVLFSLRLKANSNTKLSKALSINSLLTRVEAYSLDDEVLGIAIDFIGSAINEQPVLHQNVPNPFAEETSIGFYLPKAAHATLQIRDSKGALVHQIENNFAKGNSKLIVQHKDLGASGVFYYTLKTDVFMDTKKMVLLAR